MYTGISLFDVPALADDDVDAHLAVAGDADVDACRRIAALHALRGVSRARRLGVARALVAVLNEDDLWLGSEAIRVLDTIAPELPIGVRDGVLVPAPSPITGLVADAEDLHCPALGLVTLPCHLAPLVPRLPPLSWLAQRPGLWLVDVDGKRLPERDAREVVLEHARLRAASTDWLLELRAGTATINGVAVDAPPVRERRVPAGATVAVGAHSVVIRADGPPEAEPRSLLVSLSERWARYVPAGCAMTLERGAGHIFALGGDELAVVTSVDGAVVARRARPGAVGEAVPLAGRYLLRRIDDVGVRIERGDS